MTFFPRLTFGLLLGPSDGDRSAAAIGCSGNSSHNTPAPAVQRRDRWRRDGAAAAGSGGGGGSGGSGAARSWRSIPCNAESSYVDDGNDDRLRRDRPGFNYAPKCLKVSAGATVTFNGDFASTR